MDNENAERLRGDSLSPGEDGTYLVDWFDRDSQDMGFGWQC